MKLSEIGLILLAAAAVTGLFSVVTAGQEIVESETGFPEETDPMVLLEHDLTAVCIGSGLRDVPSASADTVVRSMDLMDTISVHQANLHITRTLREHGFEHVVTYLVPDKGLIFLCHTLDGEPLRFELNNTSR
jgi:hypothetical protein